MSDKGDLDVNFTVNVQKFWSALATAPTETSVVAKVAIKINTIFYLPLTKNSLEGVKLRF